MPMGVRQKNFRTAGFTLVEMMVAMVLGLILIGGVISLFAQSRGSFRLDEDVARMQDQARFAITELGRDLRMAGYVTEALFPGAVDLDASLPTGIGCGPEADWLFRLTEAAAPGRVTTLTGLDNTTGGTASGTYNCIGAADVVANTDIVAIKRVAGGATAAATDDRVYIRSNGTVAMLHSNPASTAIDAPFQDWEYRPRIYYVRPTTLAGASIPSLCRITVIPGPDIDEECIAEGIEDLQVEYGIDTDFDGTANRYLTAPDAAQLENVVSVRVFLLARTVEPDWDFLETRTYRLSNAPARTPVNDRFHRRVYSVTATVHNSRSLQVMGR